MALGFGREVEEEEEEGGSSSSWPRFTRRAMVGWLAGWLAIVLSI